MNLSNVDEIVELLTECLSNSEKEFTVFECKCAFDAVITSFLILGTNAHSRKISELIGD